MSDVLKAKVAGLLLSSMFLAFGAFFLAYCLRQWRAGRASEKWPETEGVITLSQVRHGKYSPRNNDWTVVTSIKYEYEVGGRRYVSERVSFGAMTSDADRRTEAAMYGEGMRFPVYYDPADPKVAVLETGVQGGVYTGLVIGAVCALIGLVLMYAMLFHSFGLPTRP
jgi:hypothetical protein